MRPLPVMAVVILVTCSLGMHCGPRPPRYRPEAIEPRPPAVVPITARSEAGCGDGQLQPGEACDDGNATPFDGCHACHIEAASCAPEAEGVVRHWRCQGAPSQCELASCGAGVDCPPELATIQVALAVREAGYLDPARSALPTVRVAGVACSCRETPLGRTCDPGCTAAVPACTTTLLDAGVAARWGGACSGRAQSCPVRQVGNATVEAWVDAAPVRLSGVALLPDGVLLTHIVPTAALDGAVLIAGQAPPRTRLGGQVLGQAERSVFVARLSRAGTFESVIDLGDADTVAVEGLVGTAQGGAWVLTGEGMQRDQYRSSPLTHPRFALWHLDAHGRPPLHTRLGVYVGSGVLAATPDGGVVAALSTVRWSSFYGGKWSEDGLLVVELDALGEVRWRKVERPGAAQHDEIAQAGGYRTEVSALRVDGDRVRLAGLSWLQRPPTGLLRSLGAAHDELAFRLSLDRRGAVVDVLSLGRATEQQVALEWLDGGELLVRRTDASTLARVGPDGAARWTLEMPKASYAAPVRADAAGARFVALFPAPAAARISVFDADGQTVHEWQLPMSGGGLAPVGFDGAGDVVLTGSGTALLGEHQLDARGQSVIVWLALPAGTAAAR